MELPKFEIGQVVWFASARRVCKDVPCSCCGTTKLVKLTMHDGTEYMVECDNCQEGYYNTGYEKEWYDEIYTQKQVIGGYEYHDDEWQYKVNVTSNSWNTVREQNIFLTEEEAVAAATRIKEERALRDLNSKDKPNKTWSFHVGYHKRCIKDREKQIAYHEAKLGIAKQKAKE